MVRYGSPVLVIDIGTAVTLDAVSADRRFLVETDNCFARRIADNSHMIIARCHIHVARLDLIVISGFLHRQGR